MPEGTDPCLFVCGATGYTGRALVRHAAAVGLRVVAHVRPESRADCVDEFERLGVQVDRSPWQADAIMGALQRCQPSHVFALLGTTKAQARAALRQGRDPRSESYEAVDRDLTLMLMAACELTTFRGKFVFLSSAGVGPKAPGAYMAARWAVESQLMAGSLRWAVARPSFITGPDRPTPRMGERLGAAVSDMGLAALAAVGVKGPQAAYGSMTGDVLAKGLLHIGLVDADEGKVWEASELRQASARWTANLDEPL